MSALENEEQMIRYLKVIEHEGADHINALSVAFMKPKTEVYHMDDLSRKTRNIFSFSSPLMFLPTVVNSAVFNQRSGFDKRCLKMYSEEIPEGNYNLKGFAFTEGFFTELGRMVLKSNPGDKCIWFMADNFFILQNVGGRVKYISSDGVKMENSHLEEDVNEYIRWIRSQYNDDERTTHLLRIYSAIQKTTMVNAVAFIEGHTVEVPGLGSGVPNTADWNCLKTAKVTNAIRAIMNANHNGGVRGTEISEAAWSVLEEQFDKQMEGSLETLLTSKDVDWVDALDAGVLDPAFMTQGITMKTEHLEHNLTGALKQSGYTKLDLLGFGIWSQEDQSSIFYGVLDRARAWKSLLFTSPNLMGGRQKESAETAYKKGCAFAGKLLSYWLMWGFTDDVSCAFMHQTYADTIRALKAVAPDKSDREIAEGIRDEMDEAAVLVEQGSNDLDNEGPRVIFQSRSTLFTTRELAAIH